MWVIWAALISGVLVLQFQLGPGWPSGTNPTGLRIGGLMVYLLLLVVASSALRWLVLPRVKAQKQQLIPMIIGLSLSEGAVIIGMFLLPRDQPETLRAVFAAGLVGMLQWAPFFARRKEPDAIQPSN